MRVLAALLAAVLLFPAPAAAQRPWAKAYEDGVEAFDKGNYALAEQKLREAKEDDGAPKQSRRANFSSVVYRPFIPDFYLGVIAAKQGRFKVAEELLEGALNAGLVTQGDRKNYELATSSLQAARDGQSRLAANTRTPPVEPRPPAPTSTPPSPTTTPANTTTAPPANSQPNTATNPPPANTVTPAPVRVTPPVNPPVSPPATVEPAWAAGFRRSMDAARASLRQTRYSEARSSVNAAANAAGDAASRQQADQLRREIDSAHNAEAQRIVDRARAAIRQKNVDTAMARVADLQTLAPDHAALAELNAGVDGLRGALKGMADLARVERQGVRLFLSGNYQLSAAEFERAVGAGVTSPRIYLFLASSRAAQALLAPQPERAGLVAEARKTYALARPNASALRADERFISPRILELLKGS